MPASKKQADLKVGEHLETEVQEKSEPRKFSTAHKARSLRELEAAPSGATSAIMRREGLYSSAVQKWRSGSLRVEVGVLMKPLKICFFLFVLGSANACLSQISTPITFPVRGSTSMVWILQGYGFGPHDQPSATYFDLAPSDIEYLARALKRNWHPCAGAEQNVSLIANFVLQKDGKINDVHILNSSGVPKLDESLREAITNLKPIRPIPHGVPDLDLQLMFECTKKFSVHAERTSVARKNVKDSLKAQSNEIPSIKGNASFEPVGR